MAHDSIGGPAPPVLPDVNRRPAWRWRVHLTLIAAFPVALGLAGWDATRVGPALGRGTYELLLVVGIELLVFVAIFGLAWVASRATMDELLLRWRQGFWPIPLGAGYSVLLRLAIGIIFGLIAAVLIASHALTQEQLRTFIETNRPAIETLVDPKALQQNPVYFWLTVTLVSFVLGGIREELWRAAFLAGMTGLWPKRFSSTGGRMVAVLLASVAFGVGHLSQGLLGVFLTGMLGFGLGAIMLFHRSIWPAAMAHGFFNATSLALLPWAMEHLPGFRP